MCVYLYHCVCCVGGCLVLTMGEIGGQLVQSFAVLWVISGAGVISGECVCGSLRHSFLNLLTGRQGAGHQHDH